MNEVQEMVDALKVHPLGYFEEQLNALDESIEHWEYNLANPEKASAGITDCACCTLWYDKSVGIYDDTLPVCDDRCPIKMATDKNCCEGTPYFNASQAIFKLQASINSTFTTDDEKSAAYDSFEECTKAEVDFLKSLRDGTYKG